MTVKETGVSYYGLSYVEHARRDFQELLDHHCTAIVPALSEFDIDFWFEEQYGYAMPRQLTSEVKRFRHDRGALEVWDTVKRLPNS